VEANILKLDIEKCIGVVNGKATISELENKWFGTVKENTLELDLVEVAYLMLKNKFKVKIGEEIIGDFNLFLTKIHKCLDKMFWPKLLVYQDLRDRGRRVRVVGNDRFLIKDKSGDLKIVVVLEEGGLKNVSSILEDLAKSIDLNISIVYAIVSLQGDLTYYEVKKIEPRKN